MVDYEPESATKLPRESEPIQVEVYLMKSETTLFVSQSAPVFEPVVFRVLGHMNRPRTRYRPDVAIALFDPDERTVPELGTREKNRLGAVISQAVMEKSGCACGTLKADQIDMSGGIDSWL